MAYFLGTMPWKGAPVGRTRVQSMPIFVEHPGIHDVEAATPIHQYLGEPLRTNNRVDHERISPWLWDAIRVVGLVEGYGRF